MHNATRQAVPLTWLLLDSQSMVDLIANPRIFLNIRKVQSEEAIRMHCNSEVKIVNRFGDLPGYRTVWYKPTGFANILTMSRATNKFRGVFDSKSSNLPGWSSQTGN